MTFVKDLVDANLRTNHSIQVKVKEFTIEEGIKIRIDIETERASLFLHLPLTNSYNHTFLL